MSLLLRLFLASIFVGDVWLVKLTLPLAVLVLLIGWAIQRWKISIPAPAWILAVLLLLVPLQFFLGRSLHWRADLAVSTPIAFALLTIVCLAGRSLSSQRVVQALGFGGLVSGAIMVGMICFAPATFYLVPGQNTYATGEKFKDAAAAAATAAAKSDGAGRVGRHLPELQVVDRPMTEDTRLFYTLKIRAKNLLGGSNYIAVFFVFLFAVMLFSGRKWLAGIMAGLVFLTLSRFGIVFLGVVGGLYWMYCRSVNATRLCLYLAAAGVLVFVAAFLARGYLYDFPGATSVLVRFDLLQSAFAPIEMRPILGAERSLVIDEQNFNIVWSPHNSVAWFLVMFGLVGLALYAAYLTLVLRVVAAASATSDLWSGVLVGITVLLVWSLSEIIVLTPAFELLLASMYVLAQSAVAAPQAEVHAAAGDRQLSAA